MKWGILPALLSISLFVQSAAQNKNSAGPSPSRLPNTSLKQVVEGEIAGLHPGRDTIEKAHRRFGKGRGVELRGSVVWFDYCNHQMLTVTSSPNGIIREVTIEPVPWEDNADCFPSAYSRGVRARMGGTGRGLVFRDRCGRAREVYGAPRNEDRLNSGDKEREFVYRFERGLKGGPLILEIACDSALNIVDKIKLTALEDSAKP